MFIVLCMSALAPGFITKKDRLRRYTFSLNTYAKIHRGCCTLLLIGRKIRKGASAAAPKYLLTVP